MCNSFHYLRGGAERCYFDLSSLLTSHGHEVVHFSTEHENNIPSEYSEYFLSHADFPGLLENKNGFLTNLRAAERVLYSREARAKIDRLIVETRPDVAHLHNIAHHISPSILPVIKKHGIPIIMTLHDYKLLCPNTNFISKGEVCERCKTHRFYNVVLRQCKQDSLSASFVAGIEMYLHRILRIYEHNVSVFISPSRFLENKMREYGIQNEIIHLPNFIEANQFQMGAESGDYCLYFGRLSKEKGIVTLLEAMQLASPRKLFLAGTGPDEEKYRQFVKESDLRSITFLGHLSQEELLPRIQNAAFTVFPSESYENYPMTILESFACGKPVLGADIGAIPGLIKDGFNGLLFQPANTRDLAEKVESLFDNPDQTIAMGRNGRRQVEKTNDPERYYQKLLTVYAALRDERNGSTALLRDRIHHD